MVQGLVSSSWAWLQAILAASGGQMGVGPLAHEALENCAVETLAYGGGSHRLNR
jgi:hypothetical protein